MDAQVIIRHVLGAVIGVSVFLLAIPAGLYLVDGSLESDSPVGLIPSDAVRAGLAVAAGALGITFALWSNLVLVRVGRGGPCEGFGVAVSPRTQHLVTGGPYRYSRNPMAFGALSFNMAVALWLNSPVCLALVGALAVLALAYLKLIEEKRLVRDFGEAYEQYRRAVSMLVPWPPQKVEPTEPACPDDTS